MPWPAWRPRSGATAGPAGHGARGQRRVPAEDRSRFGINSLINRMTGSGGADGQRPAARPARQQPPVQSQQVTQDDYEEEDEQIEIPAFLRRQAN